MDSLRDLLFGHGSEDHSVAPRFEVPEPEETPSSPEPENVFREVEEDIVAQENRPAVTEIEPASGPDWDTSSWLTAAINQAQVTPQPEVEIKVEAEEPVIEAAPEAPVVPAVSEPMIADSPFEIVDDEEDYEERFEVIESNIGSFGAAISRLDDTLDEYDLSFARVNENFGQLNQSIHSVDQTLGDKLSVLEERLQSFEALVIGQMESRSRQTRAELDKLREDLTTMIEEEVATVTDGISDRASIGDMLIDLGLKIQPDQATRNN